MSKLASGLDLYLKSKGAQPKAPPTVKIQVAKQPPAKNKKKNKQQSRKQGRPPRRGPKMSECAVKFAAAVARPFSSAAVGACLPYAPDRASMKVTAIARFPVVANSTGNAFVLFSPTVSSDSVGFWYNNTTGVVPITVVTSNTAPSGYGIGYFSTLPMSYAMLTNTGNASGVEARIVSVGFRITYSGSVSSMAGMYFSYCEPSHGNLNRNLYDASSVLGIVETKTCRVSDKAFEQGFTAVKPAERDYTGSDSAAIGTVSAFRSAYPWSLTDINNKAPNASGALDNGSAPIVFGVTGAAAGSPFYVELVEHIEYVGKGVQYGLTPSHNDVNGAEKVCAAADRAAGEFNAQPTTSWADAMQHAMSHPATHYAARMALGAAGRYMGVRTGALRLT